MEAYANLSSIGTLHNTNSFILCSVLPQRYAAGLQAAFLCSAKLVARVLNQIEMDMIPLFFKTWERKSGI